MYAIYAYIDPQNHPNVGIYGSPISRVWVYMFAVRWGKQKLQCLKLVIVLAAGFQGSTRASPQGSGRPSLLESAWYAGGVMGGVW